MLVCARMSIARTFWRWPAAAIVTGAGIALAGTMLVGIAQAQPTEPTEPTTPPAPTPPTAGPTEPEPAQPIDPAGEAVEPAPTPSQPPGNSSPPAPSAIDPGAPANDAAAADEAVTEPARPIPTSPSNTDPQASGGQKGFRFGSYGRLLAGTDLRGGKPEAVKVVAYGPRIVEASYLEIDLSYGFVTPRGLALRPVITVAFDGTLFHDTGEFDAQPALRNVYLDAQITRTVSAWAGSRMYRGDDIYLFDYWPLDNQNTVGGGVAYRDGALELAAHGGVNRLLNEFQFQEIDVPNPAQGATTVTQLNRQRMVASATAAYIVPAGAAARIKLKAHGELHALASGERERMDGTIEELPSDTGFLVGAEASAFGFSDRPELRRHLNVYARYAKGLAAFDELAAPTSVGTDLSTDRANELTFGAAGSWDHALGNVLLGALARRFIDADGSSADLDDGWEYAVDVRPLARVVPDVFVGADISYQARFPRGINPNTQTAQDPAVFQIAPMLVYSPMGPSVYDRPQLRLVYRAAHLNQAARDTYVPDDPRNDHAWVHFLGVQAEWWFNSTTYR